MTYTPGQDPQQPYGGQQPSGEQPTYGAPQGSYGDQHGQQQHGEQQHAQPQYGQPQYGEQYAQPQYGEPQYGQPQYGEQQYGQAQYGAQQYDVGQQAYAGYGAPAPKSDKRTFGLWALITGLSGFLLPIGLNSIAGIVLGILGLVKENSKGMSITGIATGAFCLFIWVPVFWGGIVPLIVLLTVGAAYSTTYP